jgi:YHS domain-containing protein
MSDQYFQKNGIALGGFDVVAFHRDEVKKGKPEYTFIHDGVRWWFSSQANLDVFQESPDRYLPAYGGYCAYGLSLGYKAPTVPYAYSLRNGRLYFNFSKYVQARWEEGIEDRIRRANDFWPEVQNDAPIKANRLWVYIRYRILKLMGKNTLP